MPICCYGGETSSMNEARFKPIQAEIDKGIRLVANLSNFATMERDLTELEIRFVFLKTSTGREHEYHKWQTLKTWISGHIN
ncbi:hypothetical protein AYI68_g5060 [Smittium mucronatum]|uniref:Uncharacterized protein n=1 Tax=Smittium mucronatum TaxID=133383 RepID=A0A1R0GRD1_9FUNG|nr:hypothetical protein AYI68_g6487 [Smittium mucronatum]OLY80838.1 hypothetical protein AYI68_g5060 [Smittium mucronatum]